MKLKEFLRIKYGKNQKDVITDTPGYPIFGTGGVFGYSRKFLHDRPSVLIGRKGTINNPFYIDKPFWCVDTIFYTEADETVVLTKWFYYKLLTIDLTQLNEGTTIPSLTTKSLYELDIDVPDLSIQQHIVDITLKGVFYA